LTYPHIGNVGANSDDEESTKPYIEALIVRDFSPIASNWRASETAQKYLERYGVPVIWEIDTRALVRHLREVGALRGIVATDGTPAEQLIAEARALPTMAGQELASRVTSPKIYSWSRNSIDLAAPLAATAGAGSLGHDFRRAASPRASREISTQENSLGSGTLGGRSFSPDVTRSSKGGAFAPCVSRSQSDREAPKADARYRVVAYDFGIKRNILRLLVDHGCDVTVVPAQTSAEDVLAMKPNGVFLSNGPGDPEPIGYAVANIRKLLGRLPIFGICLGHQLCGLALGGRTFKLKFGHHGSNHPVKNLLTQKVEITAQNHGFCVDPESLPSSDVELTHMNLNDGTNEGMRHRSMPLFSVQYHPEASPGPHDARYLFDDFISLMAGTR
jgi:carbamoyl-phosphate synthase small subunit